MEDVRVIGLTVPADVGLGEAFLDRLEMMMAAALGSGWRLREWYEVDFEEEAIAWPQQYEFVYVPETCTEEERLAELSSEATAAINLALPEISRLLTQSHKLP